MSSSAADASASSESDVLQVMTLYSDGACSGTPLNMAVTTYAECYGDASVNNASVCNSTVLGSTTYYYTYECSTDRVETIVSNFGTQDFFGYDIFDDDACSTYYSTVVYLAVGTCQAGFSNESATAALYDNGSAALEVYWDNEDCSSDAEAYFASADNLTQRSCFTYSGYSTGYVYFTSTSLESTSTSGSGSVATSSGTNAGAAIGIAVGCLIGFLLLAGLFVWNRRRKQLQRRFSQDIALLEPGSKKTRKTEPMDTDSASWIVFGTERCDQLWDDEVIISSRVPREKIVSEWLISRGGYGEVYKGTYNGQDVAIKMLLPETRRSLKHVNAFLAEVKMNALLEHSRIVQFIGVAWDSLNDLCVLSEYMDGGDLRALLVHYEETNHSQGFDHDKVKIALHIAHALTYLHTLPQPVIHRDLKSKNVLLSRELDAKLTDFGVSREREDRTMTAGVGTSLWMAPEVMMGDKYDVKADMFSFGVMLSELDLHSLPYSHAKENSNTGRKMPDAAILQMVAMGTLRVAFSPDTLPLMIELGLACVAVNPLERPTAGEALYKLQLALSHWQNSMELE